MSRDAMGASNIDVASLGAEGNANAALSAPGYDAHGITVGDAVHSDVMENLPGMIFRRASDCSTSWLRPSA